MDCVRVLVLVPGVAQGKLVRIRVEIYEYEYENDLDDDFNQFRRSRTNKQITYRLPVRYVGAPVNIRSACGAQSNRSYRSESLSRGEP
eukprot:scaffold342676_cov20-Prasinocladus_malaysianus.AAC.1